MIPKPRLWLLLILALLGPGLLSGDNAYDDRLGRFHLTLPKDWVPDASYSDDFGTAEEYWVRHDASRRHPYAGSFIIRLRTEGDDLEALFREYEAGLAGHRDQDSRLTGPVWHGEVSGRPALWAVYEVSSKTNPDPKGRIFKVFGAVSFDELNILFVSEYLPSTPASLPMTLNEAFLSLRPGTALAWHVAAGAAGLRLPGGWIRSRQNGLAILQPADIPPGVICQVLVPGPETGASFADWFGRTWAALKRYCSVQESAPVTTVDAYWKSLALRMTGGVISDAQGRTLYLAFYSAFKGGVIQPVLFLSSDLTLFQRHIEAATKMVKDMGLNYPGSRRSAQPLAEGGWKALLSRRQ